MTRRQAVRRAVVLLGTLVALVVGLAGPASAHAFLVSSSPADGATVSLAPRELQLHFSESVVLEATHVDLVDSGERHVAPTGLSLHADDPAPEPGSTDTESPTTLVVALPSLAKGAYRVSWQTLSTDDLHRTSGVLVFGIGEPVSAAGTAEPQPRPDEAVLRWLLFTALAVGLGGHLVAGLLRRQGSEAATAAAERCARWAVAGATRGALLGVVLLLDQTAGDGQPLGRLLTSGYAGRWAVREAGLVGLAVALRGRGRAARAGVLLAAVAACTGTALLGHAGSGGPSRTAADALHLGATALWAGGVVVLALTVPRLRRAGGAAASAATGVLRGFGPPAAGCVAVLVVTGVYLSSDVVGSVDAALLTTYGRVLLLKVALAGVAGGLGAWHAVRLRRGAAVGRTLLAEGGLALVVLLLAGVLTSSQPATEPELVRAAGGPVESVVDGRAGDLQETVSLGPNRPGASVALVAVYNTRRPAPAPVSAVAVAVLDRAGRPVADGAGVSIGGGRWSAPVTLPAAGPTRVRVTARRAGLPDEVRTFDWTVAPATTVARHAVVVSDAPVRHALRVLAGGLAGLLLAGAGLLGARRRPARRGVAVVPAQAVAEDRVPVHR